MGCVEDDKTSGEDLEEVYPLRPSLFPHVPPYVRFIPVRGQQVFKVEPPEEMREMLWQVPCAIWYTIMDCADLNGFTISETRIRQFEGTIRSGAIWDTLPITEKNTDAIEFEALNEAVKINQFPAMHQLGRKDNLAVNFDIMVQRFGSSEFSFLPQTFVLPNDKKRLQIEMKSNPDKFWIVKPPNLYCGMGIKVVNTFQDIPEKKAQQCVQSYIKNPFLINNLKFDLRVYVLITCVDPLRIYLYKEGLTRFATEEYTNDPEYISDNFIHLTNFSVNKESDKFVNNCNPENPEGSKWTLTSLWKYLESVGLEWKPIWTEVKDIVIKSILSAQSSLQKGFQEHVSSFYSCYKILGYDILIDSDLRPHLIEVNTIPSLAAQADTIDSHVKNPLVAEMFNIAGFHVPHQIASKHQASILGKLGWDHPGLRPMGHDRRVYSKKLNREDIEKHREYEDCKKREDYLDSILEDLTPHDARLLLRMEDEMSQTKVFSKIWPTSSTHKYFEYFENVSYGEQLMDAFEYYYEDCREEGVEYIAQYCADQVHLKVPYDPPRLPNKENMRILDKNKNNMTNKRRALKMVIKKGKGGLNL